MGDLFLVEVEIGGDVDEEDAFLSFFVSPDSSSEEQIQPNTKSRFWRTKIAISELKKRFRIKIWSILAFNFQ